MTTRPTAEERVRAALGYPDGDPDDCTSFASASMALSIAEEHAAAETKNLRRVIERKNAANERQRGAINQLRAVYKGVKAETKALRAEVRRLREVVYEAHRQRILHGSSIDSARAGAVETVLRLHAEACPDCAAHRAGEATT